MPSCADMMKHTCKFCEKEFSVSSIYVASRRGSHWCSHCKKYSIVFSSDGYTESETLTIGNYHLVFFPAYHEANVVENNDDRRIVKTFPLDELTHESATHWLDKLKKYVLFQ
jgi:hypothetical protein